MYEIFTDVTHLIRRLRRFAQIKNKTSVFPLSCGHNNTCSRALSLADWFCNINSRCHACGYNTANGYNVGSDLFEQMCESVAPTVR